MPRAPVDRSVAAAERALVILDAFVKDDGRFQTLNDLEQTTGLFKSVICRYLLAFERHGYVIKMEEGKYQLGTAVFRLGRAFEKAFDISRYVMPVLEQLSSVTDESASYYVRNNDRRLCLYRVDSSNSLRVSVQPGSFMPMDQSASAQVLHEFSGGLQSAGAAATWIKTRSNIAKQYTAMSAPVFGVDGQLAGALTVSGPSSRFKPSLRPAVSRKLLMLAHFLSLKLGAPDTKSPAKATPVLRRRRKSS